MNLTFGPLPAIGDFVDDFYNKLLTWMGVVEVNNKFFMDKLQNTILYLVGNGILFQSYTDPLVIAGTGLNIIINPHTLVSGMVTVLADPHTMAVPANTTGYLWEHQYSNDVYPSYALTLVNTSPAQTNNLAVLLCTYITNATSVTSITPLFDIVKPIHDIATTVNVTSAPIIETFNTSWDADIDSRTGGTIHTVTLSQDPLDNYGITVFVGSMMFEKTLRWTRANRVITFLSGSFPVSDELVTVMYNYNPSGAIATALLITNAGAPTNGVTGVGANKGTILIDTNSGIIYSNTGTSGSPVWQKVGLQT